MPSRRLPQQLYPSRLTARDVVYDHYTTESDRTQRLTNACEWVGNRLWLFMPLSPPQRTVFRKLMEAIGRGDAIDAERAIVDLCFLEEPAAPHLDKHGRRLEC